MRSRPLPLLVVFAVAVAAAVGPATAELCDGRDDDGDGTVDPGCPTSCLDPRSLAAEVPLGGQAGRATLGRDRSIVWDGHGFGAAWSEPVGADTRIAFRRLDPSGDPLGPPVPVSAKAFAEIDPALDWSGAGYGIVWSEEDFDLPRVLFAFVDAAGVRVAGPTPVTSGQEASRPAIAWDGEAFVVAWAWYNSRIRLRRVTPAGALLGSETCASCDAPSGADEVALALAPAQIGIAWSDGRGAIRFRRTDRAGQPLGTPLVLHSGDGAALPAVAWTADAWTIAWSDRRSGSEGLYVARVSTAGTQLGADQRVDAGETYAAHPSLAWTGTEILAGWVGGASSDYGLRLRRLDAAGVPLAPATLFAVPGTGFPDFRASLAWTGSRPAFVREQPKFSATGPVRFRALDCCADADGDGVNACSGDLDDGDPLAFPGAIERCNGRDDDQDGSLDEGCDRVCAGAPLAGVGTRGLQAAAEVGLAAGGEPVRAWLARAADDRPGVQLVLDGGGPPWIMSPVESDPAPSGEPAVAWTGSRSATLFRDDRTGTPELRFSAHAADGTPVAVDAALAGPAPGTSGPALAWGGRRLAAGFVSGAPPAPRYTLLTGDGARLLDEVPLGAAGGASSSTVAADDGGGSVVAWIDGAGAVRLQRRDEHGGARGPAIDVAAAAAGRHGLAVVSTGQAYTVAWIEAVVVRAVVRRDGSFALPPTPLEGEARGLALAFTGEEIVLVHGSTVDGGRLRRTRLDVSGAPLGPSTPVGDDLDVRGVRAAWDGSGVRLAWTRGEGALAAVRTAWLDCAAAPGPDRVRGLRFAGRDTLLWDAVESAVYDVVTGDLSRVAQGFAGAVDACEASRVAATSIGLPPRALPRFWLTRAVVGSATGTYDEEGAGQAAPRDAAIAASSAACP